MIPMKNKLPQQLINARGLFKITGEIVVHCANCGKENAEGAEYCSNCGYSLRLKTRSRSQYYEKSPWFPFAFRNWWIFIGLMIVFWGLTELVGALIGINISFWAIVAIIFGVLIVVGAFRRS